MRSLHLVLSFLIAAAGSPAARATDTATASRDAAAYG